MMVSAEPTETEKIDDLEKVVLGEIEKLKTEPPTAEEMKRVLTRYRSSVLRSLQQNLHLAQELADYQAISGDWHNLFHEIEEIGAVKSAQVAAVATKNLPRQNRTSGGSFSNQKHAAAK